MIENAPIFCPITGNEKCKNYVIEGNVAYLPNPALDAYTLPTYDEEERTFYRIRYDMDDFRKEEEFNIKPMK